MEAIFVALTVNGDLTTGSPGKRLLRFALPIIFINLLQAVYNVPVSSSAKRLSVMNPKLSVA